MADANVYARNGQKTSDGTIHGAARSTMPEWTEETISADKVLVF